MVAPAIPIVMQKGKVFISLFALDANSRVSLSAILLDDPDRRSESEGDVTEGFFQVAAAQNPKPKTIAIAAEDAEFSHNAADGARANAKQYGFKIIYDKTYPPNTTDFSPVVRAIQAANAGSRRGLLLPAEFCGHGAVRQRARSEAENVRRRAWSVCR